MPRNVLAFVLAAAVLAAACSSGGGAPGQPADPTAGPDGDNGAAVTVAPQAELEGTCEPLPQEDDGGQFLSADLVVRNTGNTGVVVRVIARWPQPGGHQLSTARRLRLEVDESAPVRLRIDIGAREARAVKRMVDRGRPCATRVHVAAAFGAPRS